MCTCTTARPSGCTIPCATIVGSSMPNVTPNCGRNRSPGCTPNARSTTPSGVAPQNGAGIQPHVQWRTIQRESRHHIIVANRAGIGRCGDRRAASGVRKRDAKRLVRLDRGIAADMNGDRLRRLAGAERDLATRQQPTEIGRVRWVRADAADGEVDIRRATRISASRDRERKRSETVVAFRLVRTGCGDGQCGFDRLWLENRRLGVRDGRRQFDIPGVIARDAVKRVGVTGDAHIAVRCLGRCWAATRRRDRRRRRQRYRTMRSQNHPHHRCRTN